MLKRLMDLGMSETLAKEVINVYSAHRDWDGLELFAQRLELLYNDAKEYPKED